MSPDYYLRGELDDVGFLNLIGQFEAAGEATAVGGRAKQTDVHTTSWAVGDSNPTGLCVPALT